MQSTGVRRKRWTHPHAELVRRLYEARMRGDEERVRSCLPRDIVWHEPDLTLEHIGELAGPDAVLAVMSRAQEITGGTFLPRPR